MLRILRSWWQDRLLRGVLKNSGYLFSSNTLSAFLNAGQGILATRLLGPANYGLVAGILITFATNVNRLLSFRMSEVVVKYLGQYLAEGKKDRAGAVVKGAALMEAATSVFAYLVLLLLAPLAARYIAKDPHSLPLFWFYGLVLISNLIYETSTGVHQATHRFDRLALINSLQSILTFILISLAFIARGGVLEVLSAYLLGKTFAGLFIILSAWIELNKTLGKGWWHVSLRLIPNWRELFLFAVNTNVNGTVNLIVRDSETLLLGLFRSPVEVGYFRNAQGIINLIITPIDPLIGPTYAEITRSLYQKQWQATMRLLKRVSTISAAWTLAAGGVLVLFGRWLIPWIYGKDFGPAYPAFVLLLIGYGFANIFQWNRPLLLALGMPGFPLKVSALVGLVKTALTLTLVRPFGYLAEAAILSGYFVASIGLILRRGISEVARREAIAMPDLQESQVVE